MDSIGRKPVDQFNSVAHSPDDSSRSINNEADANEEICLTFHAPPSAAEQHSTQPSPPLHLGAADPHTCLRRGITDDPQSAVALLGPGPHAPVIHAPGNLTLVPFLSLPQGVQVIVLGYLEPTSHEAALLLRSSEFTALRSDVIVQAFIQATLAGDDAALAQTLASQGLQDVGARARALEDARPDISPAMLGLYAVAAVGGALVAAVPDMAPMTEPESTSSLRSVGIALAGGGLGALLKQVWTLARWCLSVRQVNADELRHRAAHTAGVIGVFDAYVAAQRHRRAIMRVGDNADAMPVQGPGEDLSFEMAPMLAEREESIVVRVHGETKHD